MVRNGRGRHRNRGNRVPRMGRSRKRGVVCQSDRTKYASPDPAGRFGDQSQEFGYGKHATVDNTHPDFAPHLTVAQTWNLVKFMREEWIEPTDLYDLEVMGGMMYVDYSGPTVIAPTLTYSNIGALGNAANGDAVYAAACGSCHGADGTAITTFGRSAGQFVREKPNEAWFKAKFGEAGSMDPGLITSTSDMQDLYAALVNTVTYPDLP